MARTMEKIPDARERERALDPGGSFIVQAPAGSGKTTLLIQRFLTLLAMVQKPEEILAITFTRKAAGQMRSCIIEALRRARDGVAAKDEHERKTLKLALKALKRASATGWNLLDNPGRLKVQTIDSFCASITRQMPLLSRLGRQPQVNERPGEMYEEAARRTAAMVEDPGYIGEAVRQVLRRLDNSVRDLEKRLVMMLGSRDQWLRHISQDLKEDKLREMLEGSIKRLVEDALGSTKECVPESITGALTVSARYAASNLLQTNPENNIALLNEMDGLPGRSSEDLCRWKAIADLLVTKTNSWRKPGGVNNSIGFPADKTEEAMEKKDGFKELLTALKGDDELLLRLKEIRALPEPRYDERDWNTLKSLLHLLPVAVRHLMDVFADNGAVDFPAISMAAIEALGPDDNPTDIMLSLDNRFQHILVDEYQDTSWTQLTLLKALTRGWEPGDGRTLFIVGDPMQSIYLFRDSEVGLFLDAKKNNIGSVELTPLTLRSNFRSQANIVQWVNDTFKGAFPVADEIITGAISYEASLAVKPPLDGVEVDLRIYRERDDEKEAAGVIEIVKGIGDGETGAILARSRTHLKAIVEELKRRDVDFRAEDLDPLGERPLIQDMLALLRALMHPYDRVAWLAILRARWCGMALSDLHRLSVCDRETPVWELVNDKARVDSLSEDGRHRLAGLVEKLRQALTLWGRVPAREITEGLWTAIGGPACYEDGDSMKDAGLFFDMVESVSTGGGITSLKALEERVNGLYAAHSGKGENPVLITTIHKAKGLEFDHVIIPGLGKRPMATEKRLLYWMERDKDLLLAPIERKGGGHESLIYSYLADVHKTKEDLEQTRLFYVAATRAKKRLYLFGHVSVSPDGIKAGSNSFLSSIEHRLTPDMILKAEGPTTEEPPARPVQRLKRLPLSWKSPVPEDPVTTPGADREAATREIRPVFDWAGEGIRRLGTVVHRYLCRIVETGLDNWNEKKVRQEKGRMENMLYELGLNRDEVAGMTEMGIDALVRALKDKRGRWILKGHPGGSVELPLTGIIDGEVTRVVIDRTFVDEKGARWVIDYKTGRHEGGSIEGFLENEKQRYKPQLERYAAILRAGGEKGEIRRGLYYPAISGWIEWGDG